MKRRVALMSAVGAAVTLIVGTVSAGAVAIGVCAAVVPN